MPVPRALHFASSPNATMATTGPWQKPVDQIMKMFYSFRKTK
jgi:hypothetical protein